MVGVRSADLSHLKALGRPEGALPNDVSETTRTLLTDRDMTAYPAFQIVVEAGMSLVLAIIGATIRSPSLREVTWRSEMKRRCVLLLALSTYASAHDTSQSRGRGRGPPTVLPDVRSASGHHIESLIMILCMFARLTACVVSLPLVIHPYISRC